MKKCFVGLCADTFVLSGESGLSIQVKEVAEQLVCETVGQQRCSWWEPGRWVKPLCAGSAGFVRQTGQGADVCYTAWNELSIPIHCDRY